MKFPAVSIDIRIAILDEDALAVTLIPPAKSECLPRRELLEVTAVPYDVRAYMEFINRMTEKR